MIVLKPIQEQAAFLLASGKLGKDVAEAVGVTPETISNWKKDVNFIALINQYKLEVIESIREKLRFTTGKALSALEHLIENGSSDTVKVNACSAVIKYVGFKSPELLIWGIGNTEVDKLEKTKK